MRVGAGSVASTCVTSMHVLGVGGGKALGCTLLAPDDVVDLKKHVAAWKCKSSAARHAQARPVLIPWRKREQHLLAFGDERQRIATKGGVSGERASQQMRVFGPSSVVGAKVQGHVVHSCGGPNTNCVERQPTDRPLPCCRALLQQRCGVMQLAELWASAEKRNVAVR